MLRDVNREQRRTVVVVTHNQVIARMADRVLWLHGGAISDDRAGRRPGRGRGARVVSLLARKLVRDTRRQWLQFAAVALTLALGVAVFGAAYDSYDNLKSSYAHIYDRLGVRRRRRSPAATPRPSPAVCGASQANRSSTPGCRPTFRSASAPAGTSTRSSAGSSAAVDRRGLGERASSCSRAPGLDAGQPDGVVVERHMADHFHLHVGDTIEVFAGTWRPLRVAGIAVSPEYLWPARSRQDLLTSPDDFGVAFAARQPRRRPRRLCGNTASPRSRTGATLTPPPSSTTSAPSPRRTTPAT